MERVFKVGIGILGFIQTNIELFKNLLDFKVKETLGLSLLLKDDLFVILIDIISLLNCGIHIHFCSWHITSILQSALKLRVLIHNPA